MLTISLGEERRAKAGRMGYVASLACGWRRRTLCRHRRLQLRSNSTRATMTCSGAVHVNVAPGDGGDGVAGSLSGHSDADPQRQTNG